MCPAAQIYIHSFSKHSLNNFSMWHPGFLGVAWVHKILLLWVCGLETGGCGKHAKESGRHELHGSTSSLFESAQERWTQRRKALGNQGVSQKAEFPEPDNHLGISPGVNGKTRLKWEVGWLERRLALGLVRGWLGWMGLKQTQRYVYQTEQMCLGPALESSSCTVRIFMSFFLSKVAKGPSLPLDPAQIHIAKVWFLLFIESKLLLPSCVDDLLL